MPRLEDLAEVQRTGILGFPAQKNDSSPWTVPAQPLTEARLALVTTAGLHRRGDRPFVTDLKGSDISYRRFPVDLPAAEFAQSHVSTNFDRTGFARDVNVVLPRDRLREWVAQGKLGSLAPTVVSFMGAIRSYDRLYQETGPEVAEWLRGEGVGLVLVSGT